MLIETEGEKPKRLPVIIEKGKRKKPEGKRPTATLPLPKKNQQIIDI